MYGAGLGYVEAQFPAKGVVPTSFWPGSSGRALLPGRALGWCRSPERWVELLLSRAGMKAAHALGHHDALQLRIIPSMLNGCSRVFARHIR